jgi:hypothetical protein
VLNTSEHEEDEVLDNDQEDENLEENEEGYISEPSSDSKISKSNKQNSNKKSNKKSKFSVLQTSKVVRLEGLAHAEVKAVKKYVQTVRNTDEDFQRQDLFDDTVKEAIEMIFETKYPDEFESWETWPDELFF